MKFHPSFKEMMQHPTPWASVGAILMGYGVMLPSPANYVVCGIGTAFLLLGTFMQSPPPPDQGNDNAVSDN